MNYYTITKDGHGAGGFLCPPGHPFHEYTATGYASTPTGRRGKREDSWGSLNMILRDDQAEPAVREQAQAIMDAAQLTCSEMWVRQVYGYFRNCYAPESGSRNASDCLIPRKGEPVPPPERHLAFLMVREYFPDHAPRLDLIADPGNGYGSGKCVKCRKTVQYEARFDAFAVFSCSPECPEGGQHATEAEVPAT